MKRSVCSAFLCAVAVSICSAQTTRPSFKGATEEHRKKTQEVKQKMNAELFSDLAPDKDKVNKGFIADTLPKFSPDGSTIAFLSNRNTVDHDKTWCELFVVNIDGSSLKRVPKDAHMVQVVRAFAWSPDGKKIAYSADHIIDVTNAYGSMYPDKPMKPSLMSVEAESLTVHNLAEGEYWATDISWSPDGKKIVFVKQAAHVQEEVWTLGSDGTQKIGEGQSPLWSPDGKKIWLRMRWRGSGVEFSITDIATGQMITYKATNDKSTGTMSYSFLSGVTCMFWSASSTQIIAGDGVRLASLNLAAGEKNWRRVIDVGHAETVVGSTPAPVVHENEGLGKRRGGVHEILDCSLSPDGRKIAFVNENDVYVVDCEQRGFFSAGTTQHDYCPNAKRLTDSPKIAKRHPSWAPDGKKLILEQNGEIWVIGADGSGAIQVSDARTKALKAFDEAKKQKEKELDDKTKKARDATFNE